ncbi:hypothetical protein BDB00DRAFT_942732 [Zychaea mexicana]|uniref:uncharacterized protein n=1 Tax=Zychaea mexicana TaxID=64656 RepID=UPI0022FEF11B|nr:uncharacterized protein BDB00DRAFT_942732 [Zychaea mexicana]KAI9485060.1 hypothetical protein BDB00DRAFT_942732 [Zychaea mexicana]
MLPELPSEIWHKIYSKLTFRECIRCTRVCRSWRSKILSWSGLWHEISNEHGYQSISTLQPYTPYLVSSAVQRFRINTHGGQQRSPRDKAIHAMVTLNFLIEHNCNSIKEVVLRQLPNLVTFVYRAVVTQTDESIEDEPWCLFEPGMHLPHENLAELTIEMFGNGRPMSMHLLLHLLPKLRRVSLNALDCDDATAVLHALAYNCHVIELIEIHDGHDDNFRWSEAHTHPGKGLQFLVVDGDDRFTDADALHPVIAKHHITLRLLRIKGYEPLGRMTLSHWARLPFPKLRNLILVNLDDQPPGEVPDLTKDLCAFLRQATELRRADISISNLMNDSVLSCLADMKQLGELRLSSCTTLSESGFIRFIQSPAVQKNLKSLELDDVDVLNGKLLNIMGESLTVFEQVTIAACRNVHVREIPQFLADIRVPLKRFNLVCFVKADECPDELLDSIVDQLKNKAEEWKFVLETTSHNEDWLPSLYRVLTSEDSS